MKSSNALSVSIDLTLGYSAEKVWKAWTDPALIMHWFGSDPDGKVLNAKLDVRRGGDFEITFRDADGTEHTCSGVYAEVEDCKKLAFSWIWKSEPGLESFVTVQLTPSANSTQMHFEHANLDSQSRHGYLEGWQRTFLKLQRMLELQGS